MSGTPICPSPSYCLLSTRKMPSDEYTSFFNDYAAAECSPMQLEDISAHDEYRWQRVHTVGDGYSPRTGHTVVAYDHYLYVFGGTDRRRRQQDLFRYNTITRTWSPVFARGRLPPRRSGALGVVEGHKMYIFGGYDGRDGNYFNDLFAFDFRTHEWELMPSRGEPPEPRTDHIMVLHNSTIYVFGGYDGRFRFNNIYSYSLISCRWQLEPRAGNPPSRRFGHSAIVHPATNVLYIFGGWDGKDTLDDVYAYSLDNKSWKRLDVVGKAPPHRYRHTTVLLGDSIFLFGGVDKSHQRFSDLQRLDLTSMHWSKVETTGWIPSSRTFHRAVMFGDAMYLLGGYDGTDRLHDLYSIRLSNLSPSSLLRMCGSYIRKNYREITQCDSLDCIPPELIDTTLWRRDKSGFLRGSCLQCPPDRCGLYSPINFSRAKAFGQNSSQMILVCNCSHSCSEHELILEPSAGATKTDSESSMTDPDPDPDPEISD